MDEEMLAPLAGQVLSIKCAVGDTIEEDDEVVVIEALKMETPVFAPCDGTVKEIRVKEGDYVEEDDVLVILST